MKTVLVTGGAGFLGSHLCDALVSARHKVFCIDNMLTANPLNLSLLKQCANFKFIHHDIINPLPDLGPLDEIYNLACPASPPLYQKDPVHTIKTSVIGMINVLDYAKRYNAKVLQASTSEVYGDPAVHPQPETYWGNVNPIGQRSCYDESKRCAETLCMDYSRQYKSRIKLVRIFNTYGPRLSAGDGRVVSNFITQALRKQAITIYGDGSQTRSFQYVDDLIRGMVAMMETDDPCIGPVNLGNPTEFTIRELAEIVQKLTNSSSPLIYEPLPSDDPRQRKPDISLAKTLLNWEPTISLEVGLERTIRYFLEQQK